MRPYNIGDDETIIGMPPGIGDLHWIMAKLESFKKKEKIKKIKVRMNLGWDDKASIHDCSIEYFDLIPFVDSAESVIKDLPFEYALAGGSGKPLFKNHGGCDYMLEFNSLLEQGIKLKDILPEYETNFDYPINKPPESEQWATDIKKNVGGKFALLFTGSVAGNEVWVKDLWTAHHWMELARKIYDETGCRPVLIGARWDKSYADKIIALDREKIIYDLVGKTTVSHLFALIRAANAMVAYQCGVVMMATKFRTPVVGFWPIESEANPHGRFIRAFMSSWLPPWAEGNGFMPFGFGDKNATPDGVFAAIRKYL